LKVTFHAGAWGSDHLFQGLNAIAGAKIRFVEVYADVASVYEGRADEFLFFLQKAGLSLAGAYGGGVFTDPDFMESDVESARSTARWIKEAGGNVLILQGGEGTGKPAVDVKAAAATADAVGQACRQEGVQFCFQPHIGSVVFKEAEIRSFLSLTNPRDVGICLDTGHFAEGGVDLVPFVVAHADRIRVVHLRDLRRKPVFVGGPFANAGKGTVNILAVLGALRGQDYHGWVVGFADDPLEDPAKSAVDYAAFLTSRHHLKL
jgi:inosose dehydratase